VNKAESSCKESKLEVETESLFGTWKYSLQFWDSLLLLLHFRLILNSHTSRIPNVLNLALQDAFCA
jgi:hypothetical protein